MTTRKRAAMSALVLAILLAALDQTIVSTALPRIAADLDGFRDIAWVSAAYLLASTAATPIWGKLGDMLGRRRLYLIAIVAFLIASALCGVAQNLPELIAARVAQGLAGGGLTVLTFALVGDIATAGERGRYQAMFGSVYGVASVAGPLLGGVFTDTLSWRLAFLINVPVGLVAVVLAIRSLPAAVRRVTAPIDYAGATLLAGVATALVLVASFGDRWGWTSWPTIALAAAAVALAAAVVPVERRAAAPVLPLSMLTSRTVVVSSAIGFIANVLMFSALVYLPTYLQIVDGVSATLSGVFMLPLVAGLVASQTVAGRLIGDPARQRPILLTGLLLNVAGLLLLSTLTPSTPTALAALFFLVMGVGIGMVPMVVLASVQNSVSSEHLGAASAIVTFSRSIGAALGVAVFGSLLTAGLPSAADTVPAHFAAAIDHAFLWLVPLAVIGTALTLALRRTRPTTQTADAQAEPAFVAEVAPAAR
ncbi:MDR family MFS transporter [Actinoplanes sp. NPDC000266]